MADNYTKLPEGPASGSEEESDGTHSEESYYDEDGTRFEKQAASKSEVQANLLKGLLNTKLKQQISDEKLKKKKAKDEVDLSPKFMGCLSIKTGFYTFGIFDTCLFITCVVLALTGTEKMFALMSAGVLFLLPNLALFPLVLTFDSAFMRRIYYIALGLKMVAQITLVPIMIMKFDNRFYAKKYCEIFGVEIDNGDAFPENDGSHELTDLSSNLDNKNIK
jgi:hypothetical protein